MAAKAGGKGPLNTGGQGSKQLLDTTLTPQEQTYPISGLYNKDFTGCRFGDRLGYLVAHSSPYQHESTLFMVP